MVPRFGQQRRPASRGGARDGGKGLLHRDLHGARRICRAGRCRGHGPRTARPRSPSSLDTDAGGCHRDGNGLRGRRHGGRSPPDQFRRRVGLHPSRRARLWQFPWLSRRLSHHQPQRQLRTAGAGWRRHAARLLVHRGPRARRPRRSGAGWPPRRAARHRAPWRQADQHPQGAVLFAADIARGFFGHMVSGGARFQPVPQVVLPAGRGRRTGAAGVRADAGTAAPCRAPWPAAPSMQKA